MATVPTLSLVIPCYNEQDNLRPLIAAIRAAVDPLKLPYEVVITDDCSKDKSWEILKELAASDPRIRAQRFAFNCGESAASWAGLKAARGQYLVTLDADLQNDPKDLPKFLEALKQFDCVCGTRVETRGRGRQLHSHRLLAHCQLGAEQAVGRADQRRRLHLPRLQARVHREPEVLQRHAPLPADAVQDRRLHRDRDRRDEPTRVSPAKAITACGTGCSLPSTTCWPCAG